MSTKDRIVDEEKAVSRGRRDFLRKGAYAAPVILTLTATPAFASCGSGKAAQTCHTTTDYWSKLVKWWNEWKKRKYGG